MLGATPSTELVPDLHLLNSLRSSHCETIISDKYIPAWETYFRLEHSTIRFLFCICVQNRQRIIEYSKQKCISGYILGKCKSGTNSVDGVAPNRLIFVLQFCLKDIVQIFNYIVSNKQFPDIWKIRLINFEKYSSFQNFLH